MNKLFIGIDPSINSTGIVCRLCDASLKELSVTYYILKGNTHEKNKKGEEKSPLTKKELDAQKKYNNFNYILYDKFQTNTKETSVANELAKTTSFISLINKLTNTIYKEYSKAKIAETYVVIEGISYGSTIRTSSVFDLAGLNYMIRHAMMSLTDNVIIAPPTHVKKFATGVGNAKKELIIETFQAIHPEFEIPKIDDIADAFFMSRLAQSYYERNEYI